MEKHARGLHADGHHGGERRQAVRRLPRRPGRVRAAESQQKATAAREKGMLQGRDRRRCSATSSTTTATAARRDVHRGRAPARRTPRSRASRSSSRRSPQGRRSPPATASPLTDGAARGARDVARRRRRRSASSRSATSAPSQSPASPEIMGIGPVPAVRKLLAKTGLKVDGHRPLRAQRGVRGQSVYCTASSASPGEAQRQRRRDRARPPARLHRREAHGDAAPRAAPPRRPLRRRHDVHRRRPGRGGLFEPA